MNKCNVPKKKNLVISNNKFSQDTVELRKVVVRTKTGLKTRLIYNLKADS